MLNGVAILVYCAMVKVADFVFFVQLFCVVEVAQKQVLALFQSLVLGASEAAVTTIVGMQLVHRFCT